MKKESSIAVSRRGFLKGAAALGTAAAMYGCGKDGDGESYIILDPTPQVPKPDVETNDYFYVMGGHNCGTSGGCVSKAWVKNGRIVRVSSFEDEVNANGVAYGRDALENPLQRPCGRCRANKFRVHHPGRLKYPLKQTKLRGDLSGFVRISWDQAYNEICRKHKAIITKYGPESITSLYACGAYTSLQGGGYTGLWAASGGATPTVLGYLGGSSGYHSDYSYHQGGNWSNTYVGYTSVGFPSQAQLAGGTIKNLISFGDNSMSSRHNKKQGMVSAYKLAKKNGTNVIYIAPEFVDTGVNIADEFIPTKPYTTAALMTGMLHEMLINTFNPDGSIMANPWLDVEYLDAAVYGFFDSPEYWIKKGSGSNPVPQGTISMTDPGSSSYTKIDAVAPGMSWSAYIMGDDDRLTKAKYNAVKNYVANKYAPVQEFRNMALCNQPVAQGVAKTEFIRKKEYRTAKTAEWASKITGIPTQRIKELAKMYCDTTQHPIYHTYGYGMEKQLDGIMNRFTLTAFMVVTKTYGMTGHGIASGSGGSNGVGVSSGTGPSGRVAMPNQTLIRPTTPVGTTSGSNPVISVAQWHNAIRMAFMDVMLDPNKGPVYQAKHIPDYKPTVDFKSAANSKDLTNWKSYVGRVYNDDGGAKALVKLQRASYPSGTPQTESGTGANLYVTEGTGTPVYSGYRWLMNSGGNILMNQHMNPNDTAEMLESIPSCGQTNDPDNADDLCIMSFDNFLSPSPRWSDYVFPAKALWEQVNYHSAGGQSVLIPGIVEAPGECKDAFEFTRDFLAAYEKIDSTKAGMSLQFTGHDNAAGNNTPIPGDTYLAKFKRAYERAVVTGTGGFAPGGRYYGKTFEQALKVQYAPPVPVTTPITPTKASTDLSGTRKTMEDYVAELKAGTKGPNDIIYANISTATGNTGAGSQYMSGTTATAPGQRSPGRFMVYTEQIQWAYRTRFERWHKHLSDKGLPIGQREDDIEGDPIIPVIPMYFNYEDSFMEAYGGPARMAEMPEDKRFLVTSTHTIHRAHSSVAESPLVRELTHRVRGGGESSGNDWQTYALSSKVDGEMPRLNSAIKGDKTDFRRASWTEVLMNEEDGRRLGIKDGDIIEMRNPIGAVRVAVKLTKRAAKGYIALNQGAWYDPDPIDGVDDGGCVNTIMCTRGSRLDHGNGQQSAMVSIKKAF